MDEKIDFINISSVQYFADTNSNDIRDIDSIDTDHIDSTEDNKTNKIDVDNSQDNIEFNIQCLDNRCGDELIQPLPYISVNSRNLDIVENFPETPTGIKDGVIAKIPVILAQLTVPFHVSSIINLPELALEIKDIKKSLKVTQCILIQPTNVLFIKGFVRKNIDYSTMTYSNIEEVCGEIHHCTVDTPFECSTSVTFFRQPIEPLENTRHQFQYHKDDILPSNSFSEKDNLLSGDLSEFNQISEEFFNELPFCKLLSSKIVEFNELINRTPLSSISLPFEENFFIQIEEKMVIELKLEILQNQQIVIPPTNNKKVKNIIKK